MPFLVFLVLVLKTKKKANRRWGGGLSTSCAAEADKQAGRSMETELIQGFQRAADLIEA